MSETSTNPARKPRSLDVAIVGMACRFPGAGDLFEFWKNIVAGRDCTGDVPADRWDSAVFFDPDSKANDRVACKRGGYLDPATGFDPTPHGVMPLAVEGGEPEQFLILDAAQSALADAGLSGGVPDGRRVEVVIGRGNYFNRGNLTRLQHGRIVAQTLGILRALHPEWTAADLEAVRNDLKASLPPFEAATIAGQITNATAGRVADRLDLSGASYVVDAASASSLVAVDLGSRALVERRADIAIVGGVYLQPDVDFPMVFSRLGALSRRGQARPFAESADGTLPGEGVGVVVLKRLADAERDGDRVYAVIKAVGIASDGRGAGLAAPSARGHARAIRRAYQQSRIDPATVDYLEAHGLGVPASDRAELRALRAVFTRPQRGRRTLGALASLIGHAMPAAGMAGLIKTALALHHRLLPPSPSADDPHPLLRDEASPFALIPTARPWTHGDTSHPRRAGVNAFGFAGINAHALLEEHPRSADGITPGCMLDWETEAILLGADDRAAWIELASALIDWLDTGQNERVSLKDLAATLNTGQRSFRFRVGLVVESTTELRERLRGLVDRLADPKCRSIRDAKGTYFWDEPLAAKGTLAFLFPGEGSQYPGMLADLCPHFPELRQVLDTSNRLALERNQKTLPSDELFGRSEPAPAGLWEIETAVNVVLSSQWALYQLLSRLGLRPDSVVGHSSGEFLALAAAGVFETDRALEDRLGDLGAVFGALESAGLVPTASLVAVAADRSRVEAACRETDGSVGIAIDNCPHQVVVAGQPDAIEAVSARLRGQGVMLEALPFSRAYHTPRFARALAPIRAFYEGLDLKTPAVPVYSCASTGRMGDDIETIRRLAVEQWVAPVAFRSTVEAMYADGVRVFVEVGARGNLTGFVEDTLRGRPHFAVAANVSRRSGISQLNHLVAALYAQGVAIRPDHLYVRRRPQIIDLAHDFQPPKQGPPLAIGFPEMKMSEALVARLRDGSRPVSTRLRLDDSLSRAKPGKSRSNGHHEPSSRIASALQVAIEPAPAHALNRAFAPSPPVVETDDETLLNYFRTMDAFLETQRQVMGAYLEGRAIIDEPLRFEAPLIQQPDPVAEEIPPAPTKEAEPDAGVRELLLEQVSRRTGYPREMLDLDYDMEGDLGIDSIKRVEILGELQARGAVPDGIEMEKLSRCRTLGQIVGLLDRKMPAEPPVAARWVGEIERHVPGRELVAVRWLDARNDPVAQHHTLGGRRLSAIDPARRGLPVVPFTVMAELLAQAAAVLVPGKVVIGLKDVQANRWLTYDENEPVALEVRAERDPSRPDEVRVAIRNRGSRSGRTPSSDDPTVAGIVVFADRRESGALAPAFRVPEGGACRFTAEELYRDQWLFHGPALQALTGVGLSSRQGIDGTIRVLPRRDLLPERLWPTLHTDPIVLDNFTHLLGCWGLDKKAGEEGDLIFPLRLAELKIFGADPAEGSSVECRIKILEITRHRVRVEADLIGPDGRLWMTLRDWEDWRFYWPGRYRDVFRKPDTFLVGEPLSLPGARSEDAGRIGAVWLEPPADMARPVWRDVLEWVQLSPAEREADHALGEVDTARIWPRIAAKEAVRRLWIEQGRPPVYPADLEIQRDPAGRPRLRSLVDPNPSEIPSIATAYAEGVAVAIASLDPAVTVGIGVDWLVVGDEREARLRCARQAAGLGPVAEVVAFDIPSGEVLLRTEAGSAVRCVTARRGDHVWAWTSHERINL